jgi:leucyl aminopeptidase
MNLSSYEGFGQRKKADLIILPFWQDEKKAVPACPLKEFASIFGSPMKLGDFHGKEGECLIVYRQTKKEGRALLLGLGKKNECHEETIRRAYGAAVKAARKKNIKSVNAALPEADFPVAAAATEGMLLANYSFDKLKSEKTEPSKTVQSIGLIGIEPAVLAECKRADRIIQAVNFARDLTNGNPDDVTPEMLADTAKGLQKEFSTVKTTIFDKKRIEKEKMGLLLAVNQGSHLEPRFIIMEYRGNPDSSEVTAIIGKGITFDTGGLDIKGPANMLTMKDDMSGAAAVLGTIKAAASLRLKVNILGAIASTENAIGPKAYKPGNVYKSYAGKTVEITDTDAEGRLVLADALAYVEANYKPSRMIDLATLTGSIIVALGEECTGLYSNNDELAEQLTQAGKKTYERLWRMPLIQEYKENIRSPIADLKNSSGDRRGGSIIGALFIQHFIKKVPWAHLDIGGTAYLTAPKYYHTTNATGIGVRLLIEFLASYTS